MKEKYLFAGIIVIAIIVLGGIAYRSIYRAKDQTVVPSIESVVQPQNYTLPTDAPSVTPPTAPPGASSTNVPASQPIVFYTDTGFTPVPITISVGQTVTFSNKGLVDMWVASAPHPTHTDYPGFDSLRPIAPGGSYSFIFARVGTWKYHNHLNPRQYGSVVVTE